MTSRLLANLAVPALIAIALSGLADSADAQQKVIRVDFTFNWPAGLQARVVFRANRTQRSGKKEISRTVTGHYDLSTVAVDEGLKVQFRNFQIDPDNKTNTAGTTQVQQFMANIGAGLPDFVVDSQGRLIRLEGVTDLRRRTFEGFEELSKALEPALKKRLLKALNGLISDSRLKSTIQQFWQRDVSAWHGRSEPPGTVHRQDGTNSLPHIDGTAAPTRTIISFVDMRPCNENSTQKTCAYLTLESLMAVKDLNEEQQTKLRAAIPNAPTGLEFHAMRITNKFTLLTDPATLLPYQVTTFRDIALSFSHGEQQGSSSQIESRETTYAYKENRRR